MENSVINDVAKLNEKNLSQWMEQNVENFCGPITVTKFAGGQSNPTFKIATPNQNYVLRRKPPGQLLAGAHAVDREYRVIKALGSIGFPVPKVFGLCDDDNVIGSMFYLMDLVEGRIFWDPTFSEVPKSERHKYFEAMNQTLAALHNVDYKAVGLGDYGKEGQYVQRQIKLWTRQYLADEIAGRNPHMDKLIEWLPLNVPENDETTISHGDFRCDNMIFHPTEPRVIAVLDWELSTLGNPLADFAYHLMTYRMPQDLHFGLVGNNLNDLGIPSEEDYVKLYLKATKRENIENLNFYLAFNMFRLAAIIHGIKGRMLRGNASNAEAEKTVSKLDGLAQTAWNQAVLAGAN